MNITKLDSLDFAAAGITAMLTDKTRPIEFSSRRRSRSDASVFVGASIEPGSWDVIIKLPSAAARDALIATLDSDLNREKRLEAVINGVTVAGYASLRRIELPVMATSARLTFEPTFPTWRAVAPVTTTQVFTANGSLTATVPGNTRTAPLVRIKPTAQRATQTATVGWKRRTRYRITNGSDETWYRMPARISLGSTTAVVSGGRALASGNDVRVWLHGREVARTLVTWNTAASYVWVIIPKLSPGATIDFDVMWSNAAAAGTPPVLAYPDLPPFDIPVSTNGMWRYNSSSGRHGAWYISSTTTPPLIDQDVPGAWRTLMTLPNPDNVDDVNQAPFYLDGTFYISKFHATRAPAGTKQLPNEGLGDGIGLHHPCGITSVAVGLTYRNDYIDATKVADGPIGKIVVLTRTSGAAGWTIHYSIPTASHNAYTATGRVTHTPAAAVKNVAFAVWPLDEIAIKEETVVGDQVEARWTDYCDVSWDATKMTVTLVQAETEVYELAAVLSVDPNDGYSTANELRLGVAGSTGALDVPRLAVELNQVVILDGETRNAEVWNSALSAKVETIPMMAVRAVRKQIVLSVPTEFATSEWLPMRPTPAGVALNVAEAAIGTLAVDVLASGEWVP